MNIAELIEQLQQEDPEKGVRMARIHFNNGKDSIDVRRDMVHTIKDGKMVRVEMADVRVAKADKLESDKIKEDKG